MPNTLTLYVHSIVSVISNDIQNIQLTCIIGFDEIVHTFSYSIPQLVTNINKKGTLIMQCKTHMWNLYSVRIYHRNV